MQHLRCFFLLLVPTKLKRKQNLLIRKITTWRQQQAAVVRTNAQIQSQIAEEIAARTHALCPNRLRTATIKRAQTVPIAQSRLVVNR